MNYIVFDLEWNQAYGSHDELKERMPFEIIEIGAVKLNEKLDIIDTFSSIIKPKLYKKLQPHIKSILNYDESTLFKGKPFDMVCREFMKWCGEDYIFCTWGSMDLYYLQNNMDFYYMRRLEFPVKYFNIQQIYATYISKSDKIVKLEKAINELNIDIDKPFHSAINDAYYTGMVLKNIGLKELKDRYSYDYYNIPDSEENEIIDYHNNCLEHITREFTDKKEAMLDKELLTIKCYKCKRKAIKKIKWFANSPHSYICTSRCWYHGNLVGKIKFKQLKNGNYFAIKTVTSIDKQGIEDIKSRQIELRKKRQEKRLNSKKSKDLDNEQDYDNYNE